MYTRLIGIFCLLFSSIAYSADEADYLKFFEEYQRLSSAFDASVNTLYAADAKIMGARKKPDGTEESMTIDGTKWKTIIIASMERAKQLGDSSQYSDVSIEVDANRAKISATRYALSSCFTDDRFYMIVESSADEQLQIVEQFMETPTKTECKDADAKAEAELPEFLKTTVSMINEQLPAAIDAETQLVRTSSEGSKLIYHYLLINHTSESLTTEEVTAKLEPMIVKQSCTSPNLRPILDQKGSVTYIYRGSDAKQIAKFDVDLSACSG